ncbi:hypothetical protein D3C72_2350790 [compost metagenome]
MAVQRLTASGVCTSYSGNTMDSAKEPLNPRPSKAAQTSGNRVGWKQIIPRQTEAMRPQTSSSW